jgi:hypothetical protein
MNWKAKALELCEEKRREIRYYISQGIKKEKAVEMVLKDTTIGAGFCAQLRYEFK